MVGERREMQSMCLPNVCITDNNYIRLATRPAYRFLFTACRQHAGQNLGEKYLVLQASGIDVFDAALLVYSRCTAREGHGCGVRVERCFDTGREMFLLCRLARYVEVPHSISLSTPHLFHPIGFTKS